MNEPYEITMQGAPLVEDARVVYENDRVVLLEINMKSKYCTPTNASLGDLPGIALWTTDDSLHLNKNVDKFMTTIINFPNREGFKTFCSDSARYTVRVCLVKERP